MFIVKPALLSGFIFLSACGYVTSVPVGPDNPNERGLRYYDVRPLLVIAGGQASIKYIPDPSKEYALRFGAFLAKNDMTVTLSDNGSLSSVKSNIDAIAPVDGLLQIANKIVESALPLSGEVSSGKVEGAGSVRIFDFVFAPDGSISGLRELKHIPLGAVAAVPAVARLPDTAAQGPDITQAGRQS